MQAIFRSFGFKWPVLTSDANQTMHQKLPNKKATHGNAISFLFFFYGHGMENLSAINLYGQLMTLRELCMAIQLIWCFSFKIVTRQIKKTRLFSESKFALKFALIFFKFYLNFTLIFKKHIIKFNYWISH